MTDNRYRTSTPGIPYLFLVRQDSNLTGTAAGIWITYDTEVFKTSDFNYNSGDDRVIINASGFYKIIFQASHVEVAGADWTRFRLYVNGSEVDGNLVYGGIYGTGFRTNVSMAYPLLLHRDDYIQIKADGDAGASYTIYAKSIRLIIEGMPTEGWNNKAGGYKKL